MVKRVGSLLASERRIENNTRIIIGLCLFMLVIVLAFLIHSLMVERELLTGKASLDQESQSPGILYNQNGNTVNPEVSGTNTAGTGDEEIDPSEENSPYIQTQPNTGSQINPEFGNCNDGIDNESPPDNLTDRDDPGCWLDKNDPSTYRATRNENSATSQCQDGIDNDENGVYDANDPGCWIEGSKLAPDKATYDQFVSTYNYDGVYGQHNKLDNSEGGLISQCNNNIDDDDNNKIDKNDEDCWVNSINRMFGIDTRLTNYEGSPPACSDGIDNDGNGYCDYIDSGTTCPSGIIHGDSGCANQLDDLEIVTGGGGDLQECQDGVDNDGDNLTDFPDDPGCTSTSDDDEFNLMTEPTLPITNNTNVTSPENTTSGINTKPSPSDRQDDEEKDEDTPTTTTRGRTYQINEGNEFNEDSFVEISVAQQDKISLRKRGRDYELRTTAVNSQAGTVTITFSGKEEILELGTPKAIDLNGDGVSDLVILLDTINSDGEAEMTVVSLSEEAAKNLNLDESSASALVENTKNDEAKRVLAAEEPSLINSKIIYIIVLSVVIAGLAVIFIVLSLRIRKNRKHLRDIFRGK